MIFFLSVLAALGWITAFCLGHYLDNCREECYIKEIESDRIEADNARMAAIIEKVRMEVE